MQILPTTCPACHTPRLPDEQICAACGLIFASFEEKDALIPAPTVATMHGPPLPTPIPAGAVLGQGRYRVVSLLEHADAARYHARDLALFDRPTELLALPLSDEAARERALRLSQALARLRHPALPHTFACFEEGGALFIAREPASGQPLPAQTPHTLAAVLEWGALLADALAALHQLPPPLRLHPSLAPGAIAYDHAAERIQITRIALAPAAHAPADDVAALAATLYELATGIDPHADGYAQIAELGALGAAIAQALGMRGPLPSALALARGLAALRRPSGREPLEAPDGTRIADVPRLAAWCEAHWPLAAAWLGDTLPELVALRWGDARTASSLQALQFLHHNPDERLDAAIALLDPQGFGAELPRVEAPTRLRFGTLHKHGTRIRPLPLANAGRRYVRCSLRSFPGAAQLPGEVALRPGEARAVPVGVTMNGYVSLRVPLGIEHNGQTIANVEVRAREGYWSRRPKSMGCISLILALVLICNMETFTSAGHHFYSEAQFSIALAWGDTTQVEAAFAELDPFSQKNPAIIARRNEHYYQLGADALTRDDFVAAESAWLTLYERAPDYKNVAIQLLGLYDGQASRLASQGRWDAMGRALVRLEAVAPTYSSPLLKVRPEVAPALERARAAAWESGHMLRQPPEMRQIPAWPPISQSGKLRADSQFGRIAVISTNNNALISALEESLGWEDKGDAVFSPDDTLIAVPARDGIHIAHVVDGAALDTLSDVRLYRSSTYGPARVKAVWSGDSQFLVALAEQHIAVWNVRQRRLVLSQPLNTYLSSSQEQVAFSPDGGAFAVTRGSTVYVWRLDDGVLVRQIAQGMSSVSAIAWSPDSQTLAVGSSDALRIWRVDDGAQTVTMPIPAVTSIAFNHDGSLLAILSNWRVALWRVGGAYPVWSSSPLAAAGRVQFSADGRSLVVIGSDEVLRWRPLP